MFASLLTTTPDYRHIVFTDTLHGARHAVNLAPDLGRRRPRRSNVLGEQDWHFIRWLFARAGLNASDYREQTLARRLPACLRALRVESIDSARSAVEQQPALLQAAIDAMLIGVTSFFRDRSVFIHLREAVLPALLGRRRTIRVWSAGCSDGAELYSIAILLSEMGALGRAHLLGTDSRPGALRDASGGWFADQAIHGIPRELLPRYFVPDPSGDRWRAAPSLRFAARWRSTDVLYGGECSPAAWDLILCRNLAMYLRPDAAARLWDRLAGAIAPGGFLVLGKAERPARVGLTCVYPCIFRREPEVSDDA